MSGAVQALLIVLAIVVVGLVGWQLTGGSKSAARDSARCLDPRQPGCYGGGVGSPGSHPAAGLTSGKGNGADLWRPGAPVARDSQGSHEGAQRFDVPQTQLATAALPSVSQADTQASPQAAALQVALADLTRDLPAGVERREGGGDGTLVEYVSRGGEVLFSVLRGRDGAVATDYDRGVRYQLERDGTLRKNEALVDERESPARRERRLVQRWGLSRTDAARLSRSPRASGAFVDFRRTGLQPGAALGLAQQAAAPMPKFQAWYDRSQGDLSGVDMSLARAYYAWLNDVPVLGRLVAAVLGEPPLQTAQRFGFDGASARRFLEGATEADLLLGKRLQTLPARLSDTGGKHTLRALVGAAEATALLPLTMATLQRAMDQPESVARALASLPPGYPYVLLTEADGDRQRPLLCSAATILSWAAPVAPDAPEATARLATLPADAPVALQAPLSPALFQAVTGKPASLAGTAPLRLRAFALAGPLRSELLTEQGTLFKLRRFIDDPKERPPATYFGTPPFFYASVSATSEDGKEGAVRARRGLPTGALLHLYTDLGELDALPMTVPADAPAGVRGALTELFAAHARLHKALSRHREALGYSTAGREVAERWSLLQAQIAFTGLAAGCVTQGRCPLQGLGQQEEGMTLLTLLRQGLSALRPRVLLTSLPPAEIAQIADRLGELLVAADHVAASVEPQRRFQPATRDPAELQRISAYIRAATGTEPRPDPERERAFLVRDLPLVEYRDHLAAWERGGRPVPAAELDAEALLLRRERGEVPATLGELVQRYGEALGKAKPAYLPAGSARARIDRRVRVRFSAGLRQVALVQTLDQAGLLRDVEVLVQEPGGELSGTSYDGDGRLVVKKGASAAPLGGSGCLSCHEERGGAPLLSPPARWQPGAGGPTWLTPVLSAELSRLAAARRAAELR